MRALRPVTGVAHRVGFRLALGSAAGWPCASRLALASQACARDTRTLSALWAPTRQLHETHKLEKGSKSADKPSANKPIQFAFRNKDGDQVEIELAALAGQLTDESRLAMKDILVPPEDDPDGEPVKPAWSYVPEAERTEKGCERVYTLGCSKAALEALKEYAEWPSNKRHKDPIPQPLYRDFATYVTEEEMGFMQQVDRAGILIELLEAAMSIHHDDLSELCAAYASVRVDEIAKAAPNIMAGSESIRQYLGLKNEWTADEMKHLENEMKVIKELDPNAY